MNEKTYWKKRCQLAENVITGVQQLDMPWPDGIVKRINNHREFIADQRFDDKDIASLDMYERIPVGEGVTLLRVPGGYSLEYWSSMQVDNQQVNSVTSSTFIPL